MERLKQTKMVAIIILVAVCLLSVCILYSCNIHVHSFGDWTMVKKPTCTEDGMQERLCSCGEKQEQVVPALGHTIEVDEKVPATCTKTGLTQGSHCSVCHEIIDKQETIEKSEHTIEIVPAQSASCTNAGLSEGKKCSVSGEVIVAQIKTSEPLGHDYAEATVTKKADCEHSGESTQTCKRCGDKKVNTIAATGHSWNNATCTTKKTCTVCGKTEGELAAHSYTKNTTGASCTQNGKAVYTCSVCGHSYEETISATGHSWKEATCTTPKTCTKCGATEGNALGHNYVNGTCSRCGESEGNWFVGEYVDEFQMNTGIRYIYTLAYGTFSNSATTGSKLSVEVLADKKRADDPTHIDFYLFLYEYGTNLVKQSYGDKYYDITMRTSDGTKYSFSAAIVEGSDRLMLENDFEPLIVESLLSGGTTSFYIVERERTTTNYLFTVESSNFASVLKELG